MILQKLWVSQNFSRISWVSQSRFLSGYVRLAVSFFYTKGSNTLKPRSRNLKSQNVSGSQRKTLVSPSRIYHSPLLQRDRIKGKYSPTTLVTIHSLKLPQFRVHEAISNTDPAQSMTKIYLNEVPNHTPGELKSKQKL